MDFIILSLLCLGTGVCKVEPDNPNNKFFYQLSKLLDHTGSFDNLPTSFQQSSSNSSLNTL